MLAVLLVSAVVLYVLYKLHYPANYSQLNALANARGPPIFPCIGILVTDISVAGITRLVRGFAAKYSSPMVSKFGPFYAALVYKPEDVEAVFTHTQNIAKSYQYMTLKSWLGNGLLTSSGADWHRQRKLLTPTFHFRILLDFVPVMLNNAAILVDCMRPHADTDQQWDATDVITNVALDTIMETSMGQSVNAQGDGKRQPYVQALMDFTEAATMRIGTVYLQPPYFWLTPTGWKSWTALKVLKEYSAQAIERREAETVEISEQDSDEKRTSKRPFLDLLLEMKRQGQMSAQEIQEQVDTFVFEGQDTTAHGMHWTLLLLAINEDKQHKARQELIPVLGDVRRPQISKEQLVELKYLECCIKEGLRLFPAVPFIGRQTEGHDTTAHGIQWTLLLLALNQDKQQLARQELIHILGDVRRPQINSEQLGELKYLECCIKEGLRLFPSVPLIGRQTEVPMTIDGHYIPSDVIIGIDLYTLHRDPSQFPEPEEYKPERFLPENSQDRHPFAYCPFAGGMRSCIGQKYALMEMKIMFAYILLNYELSSDVGRIKDSDSVYQLTLNNTKGVWVKTKSRPTESTQT